MKLIVFGMLAINLLIEWYGPGYSYDTNVRKSSTFIPLPYGMTRDASSAIGCASGNAVWWYSGEVGGFLNVSPPEAYKLYFQNRFYRLPRSCS